jgi:hypothetical protein
MKHSWTVIRRWVAVIASGLVIAMALNVQPARAVDLFGNACKGAGKNSAACSGNGQDNISGTNGVILKAANLIAIIAAITAVIMIMVGGFMMVTAAGDTSRSSTGQKTITYTVVGLIVIALARTIVAFVVTRVSS